MTGVTGKQALHEVEGYPLAWPRDWPRTKNRKADRFKTSFAVARDDLLDELRKLGATLPVLSTNVPLRRDGLPYADFARKSIDDPGVAVYFTWKKRQHVIACDTYDTVQGNLRAVGKSVEALRGIDRWGASGILERAFAGFAALPAPGDTPKRSCWDILDLEQPEGIVGIGMMGIIIEAAYRDKAKRVHPDHGGTVEQMSELNRARDEALAYINA